jgi:hypothetical protein
MALEAALAGSLTLTACVNPVTLNITDNSAPTYFARSVYRFDSAAPKAGIEAGYAQFRASDKQFLETGSFVRLNGQEISGPVDLQSRALVQQAYVGYNHLFFANRLVEMELLGGVGAMRVRWDTQPVNSTQSRLRMKMDRSGFIVGVGPRWKFAEHFALEGRLSTLVVHPFDADGRSGYTTTGEVAVAYAPVPQFRLRAGYFQSTLRWENEFDDSEISIKARGPQLGLIFEF